MNRIENQEGLHPNEIAYATGDERWPLARVRVTPVAPAQEERLHQPNADPVPGRIEIRMSASLITGDGSVEKIGDKLLLGPEGPHSWQFDADVTFDPTSWVDGCAESMINDLLKQARGIAIANEAGLIA